MDLPGLPKEQVALERVDGRVPGVRAGGKQDGSVGEVGKTGEDEKDEDEGGDAVRWHCRERRALAAGRRPLVTQFRLLDDASSDEMSARMAEGVLTVTSRCSASSGRDATSLTVRVKLCGFAMHAGVLQLHTCMSSSVQM
ncbi:hypothetical protein ABZP36_023309 [Zizania latifolia]